MVRLKGNENSWGLIAKIFHWAIALLLFWQVGTGISLHNMEFSPLKIGIISSHKIFGTIIFAFPVEKTEPKIVIKLKRGKSSFNIFAIKPSGSLTAKVKPLIGGL